MQIMMLRHAFARPPSPHALIGMNILAAIDPCASPPAVIYKHGVPTPVKAAKARPPAPRPEKYPERNAEPKPNRTPDKEARPWREENDPRIVVRHHYEIWIHRHDGDIGPAAHNDLAIAAQIAEVASLATLPLHRVHNVGFLREKSVSDVRGPVHVSGHHFQHGGKRQKRLNAWVPWKLIALNGVRQSFSREVVVLIRPFRCVGNLIRIGRGGQNLRHERIRIQ